MFFVNTFEDDSLLLVFQQKEGWMERKTLRRDKLERVEMQQNLENELKAKQKVEEELTHIRTQLAHTERLDIQLYDNTYCNSLFMINLNM